MNQNTPNQTSSSALANAILNPEFRKRMREMLTKFEDLQPENDEEFSGYLSFGDRLSLVENHFPPFDEYGLIYRSEISVTKDSVVAVTRLFIRVGGNYEYWFSRIGSFSNKANVTRADGEAGHAQISAKRKILVALGLMNWQDNLEDLNKMTETEERSAKSSVINSYLTANGHDSVLALVTALRSQNSKFTVRPTDVSNKKLEEIEISVLTSIAEECNRYLSKEGF